MSVTSSRGSYLTPTLEHATVADAMHPGVLSCDADVALIDAARIMATHHVHCVVVHSQEGGPSEWRILTDLDLVRAGIASGADQTAGAIARRPMLTVDPAMPLREAAAQMLSHNYSHALVVEARTHNPIGLVSTLDIAGVLAWGEG